MASRHTTTSTCLQRKFKSGGCLDTISTQTPSALYLEEVANENRSLRELKQSERKKVLNDIYQKKVAELRKKALFEDSLFGRGRKKLRWIMDKLLTIRLGKGK